MANKRLKIGLLVPFEGPAGIWAPSCEASALLAAAEINERGGAANHYVDLVIRDTGCSNGSAARAAASVIELDGAQAIVAMVPSSARDPICEAIQGRIPFLYTPQFEGSENSPGIITIGETAKELLGPGIEWLIHEKRATRFFLLGNNYLWPRRSMMEARRLIAGFGGQVVGDLEVPFGMEDHEDVLKGIDGSQPHVVISWLLGHEAVVFNRAFAAGGYAARILRFSTAIDETILLGIGADCTENLYVSSSYFSNIRSRNNDAFLEKYHQFLGDTPPPANSFGESLYEGIHCLTALVDAAKTLDARALKKKVGRSSQGRTARGFDGDVTTGQRHPIHIAAVDGHDFRLLAHYSLP